MLDIRTAMKVVLKSYLEFWRDFKNFDNASFNSFKGNLEVRLCHRENHRDEVRAAREVEVAGEVPEAQHELHALLPVVPEGLPEPEHLGERGVHQLAVYGEREVRAEPGPRRGVRRQHDARPQAFLLRHADRAHPDGPDQSGGDRVDQQELLQLHGLRAGRAGQAEDQQVDAESDRERSRHNPAAVHHAGHHLHQQHHRHVHARQRRDAQAGQPAHQALLPGLRQHRDGRPLPREQAPSRKPRSHPLRKQRRTLLSRRPSTP